MPDRSGFAQSKCPEYALVPGLRGNKRHSVTATDRHRAPEIAHDVGFCLGPVSGLEAAKRASQQNDQPTGQGWGHDGNNKNIAIGLSVGHAAYPQKCDHSPVMG